MSDLQLPPRSPILRPNLLLRCQRGSEDSAVRDAAEVGSNWGFLCLLYVLDVENAECHEKFICCVCSSSAVRRAGMGKNRQVVLLPPCSV